MSDAPFVAPPVSGSAVPIAARGANLVLAAPPSPAYAIPVLAAVLGRTPDTRSHPLLLLVPESALAPWAEAAASAAHSIGKVAAQGPTPARAGHHLVGQRVDCLVTTGAVAAELIRRSALPVAELSGVVVAWPELEADDDRFVAVFADLPKETQRVVITADPERTAPFVERYAWRAAVAGPLGAEPAERLARIRVATVGWDHRPQALGSLVDALDLDQVAVWCADPSTVGPVTARLASHGVSVGPADVTIYYDLPTPDVLATADPARSVLLMPPGTEHYVSRLVIKREPINLRGTVDEAERAMAADRRVIRHRIEAGTDRAAFATVAPLLDQYPASEIVMALQSLWTVAKAATPAPTTGPSIRPMPPARPTMPKVWAGVGNKEGVTVGEWMAFLSIDLGISREKFGRVDIKDSFTLIEFGAEDTAAEAAEKLAGRTFKGRRLTARVDRGAKPPRRAP